MSRSIRLPSDARALAGGGDGAVAHELAAWLVKAQVRVLKNAVTPAASLQWPRAVLGSSRRVGTVNAAPKARVLMRARCTLEVLALWPNTLRSEGFGTRHRMAMTPNANAHTLDAQRGPSGGATASV